jgi:SAM-dependent methyltransferase
MQIRARSLIKGAATNIFPWLHRLEVRRGVTGYDSTRYCYSVWLRHLVTLHRSGLPTRPEVVAELGPGRTLGVGFCALLSGARKYYALDVVKDYQAQESERVFRKLVGLFKNRGVIPNEAEFPDLQPKLSSYEFPQSVLPDDRLRDTLEERRLETIAHAITSPRTPRHDGTEIGYFAPWYDAGVIQNESVDLLCSQFVLEHVDDLKKTYRAMHGWLKPGGVMSHFIDFKSHGMTKDWNGHWACSDRAWDLMRGKRPYMLNREPHSVHLDLIERCGFKIISDASVRDLSGISRESLTKRYESRLDADDLVTTGALIQAVKS